MDQINIGFLAQAGNNLKELAFTNLKISYPLAFPRKSTCDFSSRTWFSGVKISMFTRYDSKRVGREDFWQVILLNRFFLMINGQKSVKPRISSSRHYFQIKFQNITLIHVFGKKSENTLKIFGSDEVWVLFPRGVISRGVWIIG